MKSTVKKYRFRNVFIIYIVVLAFCFSHVPWGLNAEERSTSVSNIKGSHAPGGDIKGKKEVVVEIGPKPIQTMKLLSFRVQLTGYREQEKILVDLSMPGMIMGINRFYLKRAGSDSYEGKSIIPICPTGKKLWMAKVIINHTVEKEILFNVQK